MWVILQLVFLSDRFFPGQVNLRRQTELREHCYGILRRIGLFIGSATEYNSRSKMKQVGDYCVHLFYYGSYQLKMKIQFDEMPVLRREKHKIVNGIYYGLLQKKHGEKTSTIAEQTGATGRWWSLNTTCWAKLP